MTTRECEGCLEYKTTNEFPENKTCPYCNVCWFKRMKNEIEAPQSVPRTWKMRSLWSATVFESSMMYEEGMEFLHVDINNKRLELNIAVQKRIGANDEYIVTVGNKKFLCRATDRDDDTKFGEHGIMLSEHHPLEDMDLNPVEEV